jgi:peptidoglycan/xylan/chitin deacetylase (PgdA/CDA1 family)
VAQSTVIREGSGSKRRVALTFDDNYSPELAVPIIQDLNRAEVPASVFLIGSATEQSPKLSELIARSPLIEVGDHTQSHPDLAGATEEALEFEIGAGSRAFRRMTGGHVSRFFRPPGGNYDRSTLRVAAQSRLPWTIEFDPGPADYTGISATRILSRLRREVHPGSILLLHFNAPHVGDMVSRLIVSLRARGYRFVTVSQLLKGDRRFFDIHPEDPFYDAVTQLSDRGIMPGFPTGDYGAWEALSREDLAAALARGLGLPQPVADSVSLSPFVDVSRSLVATDGLPPDLRTKEDAAGITAAAKAGLMYSGAGTGSGRVFWPKASVRRIDLAFAVAKAAGGWLPAPSASVRYFDVPKNVEPTLVSVVQAGFMRATPGAFKPFDPVGRAEAAVTLFRLLQIVNPNALGDTGLPDWWVGKPAPSLGNSVS